MILSGLENVKRLRRKGPELPTKTPQESAVSMHSGCDLTKAAYGQRTHLEASLHPSHLAPPDRLEVGHFSLLGRRRHNSAVWKGDKANAIERDGRRFMKLLS